MLSEVTSSLAIAGLQSGTICARRAAEIGSGEATTRASMILRCSKDSVDMDIAFQKKLGTWFFGGEGLILQRYWGEGTVFIHACGDMVEMTLEPGQSIKVDTGNAVAWEASVSYDIQKAGNIKTMVFGGEGLFLTRLTGPGKVILQSMTIANLAGAIIPFIGIGIFAGSVSKLARVTYRQRFLIRAISGLILIGYALYLIVFYLLPKLIK